jgi:pimeloyl-ACP methyl ester carboxylesterase
LDLPGYGDSPAGSLPRETFLDSIFDALALDRAVIVSPSMSGGFSLPFVARRPDRVAGFVPVAPAAVASFASELAGSRVPTLVIWGGADTVFPPSGAESLAQLFENAETRILEGARHPCYLDQPDAFHELLIEFARRVSR